MNKRTRALTAVALCGLAAAAMSLPGRSTSALWSDTVHTPPQVLIAAKARVLVAGSSSWTLPAATLKAITPETPQAVSFRVEGTSEGNPGLRYVMHAPSISGASGLAGVVHATLKTEATSGGCAPTLSSSSPVLFDGPLAEANIAARQLVASGASATKGSELLCLRLSLPQGYGDYVNKATVTMDGDGGQPVRATTEWHGTAVPTAADRAATVAFTFSSESFRPGA